MEAEGWPGLWWKPTEAIPDESKDFPSQNQEKETDQWGTEGDANRDEPEPKVESCLVRPEMTINSEYNADRCRQDHVEDEVLRDHDEDHGSPWMYSQKTIKYPKSQLFDISAVEE